MNLSRLLTLPDHPGQSVFLWGPRKTGKSTWIRAHLPEAEVIDLLQSEEFFDFSTRPQLLRERLASRPVPWVVIDEIQKVPQLLDEVHWLIENRRQRFLLTGSSARKLRRGQANLLGGRAWRRQMRPLTLQEAGQSPRPLAETLTSGLLPAHYLSPQPLEDLRAYVSDYLKEEIAAEALTRNLPLFGQFLRAAAISNGELLNLENVAREVGVSARTVANYYEILEDTLLGERVGAWRKAATRRLLVTDKFYLFDVGVANYLMRRQPAPGTPEFGKSFEQLVFMELRAYQAYRAPELEIRYWRTASGFEVDFLLDDRRLAIEVKSGRVHQTDLKGLSALSDDAPVGRRMVVCLEKSPRELTDRHGPVQLLPLDEFVRQLWAGELI